MDDKFTSEKGYTYEIMGNLITITVPKSSKIQPKKLQITKADLCLMTCRLGMEIAK